MTVALSQFYIVNSYSAHYFKNKIKIKSVQNEFLTLDFTFLFNLKLNNNS